MPIPTTPGQTRPCAFVQSCAGQPFFLWLSYIHPHTPYYVPDPYFSMYEGAPLGEPSREKNPASKPFRQQFHRANNDAILPFDFTTVMQMRRIYCGMISLLDAQVGRFLDFLSATKLAENTIVVLMSDHGDYMGDHGMMTKSPSLYDCLVRTPLIVRWPAHLPGNKRSHELVSHIDIMPTLSSAAGCAIPAGVQGIDLLPCLRGGIHPVRETVFSEYGVPAKPYNAQRLLEEGLKPGDFPHPGRNDLPREGNPVSLSGRIRMARTRHWKLVQETGGTNELYDLRNDPEELTNLYGEPAHRAQQEELLRQLEAWKSALPHVEMDDRFL